MKKLYGYLSFAIIVFLVSSCGGGGGGGGVAIVATGTATLAWTAPNQNNNGTALTDLAGFKIHYGTASGTYTHTITVANAGTTTYKVKGLSKGKTYFFVVTAYNTSGVESGPSAEGSKTL